MDASVARGRMSFTLRRRVSFSTMTPMATRGATWLVSMVLVLAGASGCVSAEQHRSALADLQRLRTEAWQRSVEAAALRIALDRAAAENAALRTPVQPPASAADIQAIAAKLEEVARRQELMAEDVRAAATCVQPPSGAGTAQAAVPKSRKVTDLLYSRF